jgi:hypothetical protein
VEHEGEKRDRPEIGLNISQGAKASLRGLVPTFHFLFSIWQGHAQPTEVALKMGALQMSSPDYGKILVEIQSWQWEALVNSIEDWISTGFYAFCSTSIAKYFTTLCRTIIFWSDTKPSRILKNASHPMNDIRYLPFHMVLHDSLWENIQMYFPRKHMVCWCSPKREFNTFEWNRRWGEW